MCQPLSASPIVPFSQRLLPALRGKGFAMDGYWVWGGSVVLGQDGRYHLFVSRWPKRYPFFHGYLAASEVVRASADTPEGPFQFEQVVLPARGSEHWDGRMTHNPRIVRCGQDYLLFYIGANYAGPTPEPAEMHRLRATDHGPNGRMFDWYHAIRIGIARSRSVFGPWQRADAPALDSRPGTRSPVVTNPSPCLGPDGRLLLYYRCEGKLWLAGTDGPDRPLGHLGDGPVVAPGPGLRIEDPCAWWAGDHYEMVCKDLTGKITGEYHAAVHLLSPDGRTWQLAPQPKAWSRKLDWSDGSRTTQGSIERPFVLLRDGRPAYLYVATADGPGPSDHPRRPGHYHAENTWNQVIPLRQP